jgi:hypothetical protein
MKIYVLIFFANRFCSECKLKVSEAYDLLVNNCEHKHHDRTGFCPNLYEGMWYI